MTVTTENSGAQALAALLQRAQPADRFAARRQFAYNQMKAGASTAPVQSWGEGLARALQAGVGGYFAGQADRDEDERDRAGLATMAALLGAKNDAERIAFIRDSKGDPRMFAPLYQHMLATKMAAAAAQGKREGDATEFGRLFGVPAASPSGVPAGPPAEVVPGGLGASGAPAEFDNNIGNIRATNINWTGKGAPHRGFETFGAPQDGANAMATNMRSYLERNPDMTVAQMIARWAPPSENNTDAYIRTVAESTGVNPAMPLREVLADPLLAATVMKAMGQHEKGYIPAGFTDDTFVGAARGGVPGGAPPAAMPGPAIPQPQPMPTPVVRPGVAAPGSGQLMPANPAAAAAQAGGPPAAMPKPPTLPLVPRQPPDPEDVAEIQRSILSGLISYADGVKLLEQRRGAKQERLERAAKARYDADTDEYNYQRKRRDKLSDEAARPSEAQKTVDSKFGEEYAAWVAGGGNADAMRQIAQLEEVQKRLLSGRDDITGPIVGNLPGFVANITNPTAVATREAIEEVVQRNLRLVLGAAFTEREGERLISRAFNPRLSEEENAKRVGRLLEQIRAGVEAKTSAAQYYEKYGTLKGWKGKLPSLADFDPDGRGGSGSPPPDAIEHLRANPGLREQFDQKFGEGSSARVLGQ